VKSWLPSAFASIVRRGRQSWRRRGTVVDWRVTLKRRVALIAAGLGLWALGIETRLFFLQILRNSEYVTRAERQHQRTIYPAAKRADIVDRKGRVLATSVDADTIYAVPSEVGDAGVTVAKLCAAFGDCTPKERQALSDRLRRGGAFTYVRRQVSPEDKRRVEDLNLDGIGFIKESRRFYPNKELGAHLLGYVGVDNVGLAGLEAAYDSQIRGKSGKLLVQTDARRHAFARFERPPTSGSTVELTIDEYLQHIAERELHQGVMENRAAGGTAIVLNPKTGEILAMANEPTFNPNAYREFDEAEWRNRAVQDLYEPGSTFKVVTASAALEEKVMPVGTYIDTNPGQLRFGANDVVREDRGNNYGVLSFTDVIVKSSNIGAIRIGFRVGTERLSRFVQRFGFGHPISPDFPSESPGIVWDAGKWTERALASVSMGYQVGVTPLQMVSAVASVANGGELVEPRVVRAIYRDNLRYGVQPKVLRRTISANTAASLTGIMEEVVQRGTAKNAQIHGFTIAGKTGTAKKLVNGHYSSSEYNASFVGFAPSRDPVVAIIVVVDSPHGEAGYHGGSVSAPIFRRIAESTLRYMGVGPNVNPAAPVLVARASTDAAGGARADVPAMAPQPSPIVSVVTEPSAILVPDLRGKSAREAVHALAKLGIAARISGDGFVVSQDPPAGSPLEAITVSHVVLDRAPGRPVEGAGTP
jgi:cell division protein FtsI/penicillin-binding protein 2